MYMLFFYVVIHFFCSLLQVVEEDLVQQALGKRFLTPLYKSHDLLVYLTTYICTFCCLTSLFLVSMSNLDIYVNVWDETISASGAVILVWRNPVQTVLEDSTKIPTLALVIQDLVPPQRQMLEMMMLGMMHHQPLHLQGLCLIFSVIKVK